MSRSFLLMAFFAFQGTTRASFLDRTNFGVGSLSKRVSFAERSGAVGRVSYAASTGQGRMYAKGENDNDDDNDGEVRVAVKNNNNNIQYPIMEAEGEDIMRKKAHGTSESPVQKDLLYGMDFETADRICNFNRHYAEYKGYSTNFLNFLQRKYSSSSSSQKGQTTTDDDDDDDEEVEGEEGFTKFYDSVTGNLLFTVPIGRTMNDFIEESKSHGWPSFRDEEVNWEYVRCLEDGECVSITGTHLGHLIGDDKGNRYCINLVSIAGRPTTVE